MWIIYYFAYCVVNYLIAPGCWHKSTWNEQALQNVKEGFFIFFYIHTFAYNKKAWLSHPWTPQSMITEAVIQREVIVDNFVPSHSCRQKKELTECTCSQGPGEGNLCFHVRLLALALYSTFATCTRKAFISIGTHSLDGSQLGSIYCRPMCPQFNKIAWNIIGKLTMKVWVVKSPWNCIF